jgi:hypothetical protein
MKKPIIVALLCVNVALLAALLFVAAAPQANAQVVRGGSDFLAVSGQVPTNVGVTYVLDMSTRRLAGLRWDVSSNRLQPLRGRLLTNDFRSSETPGRP